MTEVERMAEEFLRAHSSFFVKGEWGQVRHSLTPPEMSASKMVIVSIIELGP
jgi:hypothetical protein